MKDIELQRSTSRRVTAPVRLVYAALGLISAGLGVLGVFIPGLPTTIFLIISSYLLTRSCPWLEKKIMAMAIFKPFIPYVRGQAAMPRKARITALIMMWTSVGVSLFILARQGTVSIWVHGAIVAGALVGTVFICKSGSRPK